MDKYTIITNNSFINNINDILNIDVDNPFTQCYFESEKVFLKFCKKYYHYIKIHPRFELLNNSIVANLNDIKIIYPNENNEFIIDEKYREMQKKLKYKTPFFVLINNKEEIKETYEEFIILNNSLYIDEKEDIKKCITDYFNNRPSEKNIIYHVYALCYNESKILPHFFNHYKDADKIIILDNKSTDNSIEIMEENNVDDIIVFQTNGFNDLVHCYLKNSFWKDSKGIADFVIVQDMDEFIHFPEHPYSIKKGLYELKKKNASYVVCKGYELCCTDEEFNNLPSNKPIFDYINKGFYCRNYSKPNLINPNNLEETNWKVGNHVIKPVPDVIPAKCNILLLHYKHMGIDWELERRKELREKIRLCYQGFGTEYLADDEETLKYINECHNKSKDLSDVIFNTNKHITCSVIEYYKVKGLMGGLGNQLFTISTTLALSFEYDLKPFFISTSENKYNYTSNIFKNLEIVNDCDITDYFKITEDTQNDIIDFSIINNNKNNILIQGYFQSHKYFDKYRKEILDIIKLDEKEEILVNNCISKIKNAFIGNKIVGIHIRRTDYVNLGWNLSIEYYHNAIKKFDNTNSTFVIFSDDKEWCKKEFPDYIICDVDIDYLEMFMMSKMDSLIMSNSTFSWWGAYIGNIKEVICPYPWFKNIPYNPDIYIDHWQKISI